MGIFWVHSKKQTLLLLVDSKRGKMWGTEGREVIDYTQWLTWPVDCGRRGALGFLRPDYKKTSGIFLGLLKHSFLEAWATHNPDRATLGGEYRSSGWHSLLSPAFQPSTPKPQASSNVTQAEELCSQDLFEFLTAKWWYIINWLVFEATKFGGLFVLQELIYGITWWSLTHSSFTWGVEIKATRN